MEKRKVIDLQPLQVFLTKDVDVSYLVGELDKLYYLFTRMAMELSEKKNEPIYNDTLEGAYWIETLKEVFATIKE